MFSNLSLKLALLNPWVLEILMKTSVTSLQKTTTQVYSQVSKSAIKTANLSSVKILVRTILVCTLKLVAFPFLRAIDTYHIHPHYANQAGVLYACSLVSSRDTSIKHGTIQSELHACMGFTCVHTCRL